MLSLDKNENINYKISILDDGQYRMLEPVFPDYRSLYHRKQGFREINPKLDDG
ncbi:MAG: hypothetical protein LBB45_02915 [Methanobrevibacter sp.]|jgi:hypothetical protein|nr:hypothetical protein [Candidatus Methanovirga basalitermitum]